MRIGGIVLGLAAAVLATSPAQAQEKSSIAIYAQATGGSIQFANTGHLYGATVGLYDNRHVGPVLVGPDIRVAFTQRGASQGPLSDTVFDYGQFGVRVGAAPGGIPFAHSLMPYAEALVGISYWRGGLSTLRQDSRHSLLQLVGGVDYKIVPRISWRVVEVTYGRAGALPGHINPITLSSGVVLHLR